ncbi:unnamed protein product [Adineta steineri]|uniref:GOLD domain-containing protein n=1 Tax=Adineta steineri TaxID=433720 RepID=A0A814J820_9BILA|nr:unnamed protein product [Adineta steineri]CAF3893548.1 unnamed protein product [Adineta steineri]
MLTHIYLFISICPFVFGNFPYIKETGFKFWLEIGLGECYHELLEKGSRLYFMYEILNADTHDDHIIAYFRNSYTGSIIASSRTPQRGHLEYLTNETITIDICMDHEKSDTYPKYISVFFHIYQFDKIVAQLKEIEHFDNASINANNLLISINNHIMNSREYQMELEMLDQKDLYLLEENFFWINRWASIHIIIILSCFLFQTYFIKGLFVTSRK